MAYVNLDLVKESLLGWYPNLDDKQIEYMLDTIPTADVVEVVRCEKCKDFEPHGNGKAGICRNRKLKPCLRHDTDFCSYGKRRDT